MYETFYQLNCQPFSLLPDPTFLFPSRQHAMALTLLQYSLINKNPFTVITGEVGSGKTTLINRLLDDIDERHIVGLINFTDRRVSQLWPWILQAYGLPFGRKKTVHMYAEFLDFLCETRNRTGATTVLIVDEAQNLDPKALENLRMISNVNAKETLLQLILVGQPEFRNSLKRTDLRQLNQRVSVFYNLDPLTEPETRGYIAHRMSVAGGRPDTFNRKAVELIWSASGGIARMINTLCDLALVYGYSNNKEVIDADVVCEMLADRQDLAVVTEEPKDAAEEPPRRAVRRARVAVHAESSP